MVDFIDRTEFIAFVTCVRVIFEMLKIEIRRKRLNGKRVRDPGSVHCEMEVLALHVAAAAAATTTVIAAQRTHR